MAFIVAGRDRSFEVRESRSTPDGPRSRTLATFRELDAATIEKVIARAEKPPSRDELVEAALRVGAPIYTTPVEDSARILLRSLARGERLPQKLRRLLIDALSGEVPQAAEWMGTSMVERGDALWDLLLLADAVPIRRRPGRLEFPRIDSTGNR